MHKLKVNKMLKITILLIIFISVIPIAIGIGYAYRMTKDIELDMALIDYKNNNNVFYDIKLDKITTLKYSGDNYLEIDKAPQHLIDAFVSLEDKRFYKHNGIDYIRMVSATMSNIKSRSFKEGASTITQQLIKNTHLSNEKTIERKLKEAKLAKLLEKEMSKDKILESYLNVIYFGNGINGIANATEFFFNKHYSTINVKESAILAGIVKNPSKYSPINNLDKSIERSEIVLNCMLKNKKLSNDAYDISIVQNIVINYDNFYNNNYNSYIYSAINEACERLGISEKEFKIKGYSIYTYLDTNIQNKLANTLTNPEYLIKNKNGVSPSTAGIIVDNYDARALAFYSSTYSDAYTLKRQAGSIIKPIAVYTPALENKLITPSSIFVDEKKDFYGYSPSNFKDVYHGYVSARYAVAKSLNVPAVELYSMLDKNAVTNYLKDINISVSPSDGLAYALGGSTDGISINSLSGAYTMLANGGLYKAPTFIDSIIDKKGNLLYKNDIEKVRVVNEDTAYLMTDMLKDSVKYGTSNSLRDLGYDIAAKTGTVAGTKGGNSDAWSASYTTENTILIWLGNFSNSKDTSLSDKITGGNYPTMIAKSLYNYLNNDSKPADFYKPQDIIEEYIDKNQYLNEHNLCLLPDNVPSHYGILEIFSKNNLPQEYSDSYNLLTDKDINYKYTDNNKSIIFKCNKDVIYDINIKLNRAKVQYKRIENYDGYYELPLNSLIYSIDSVGIEIVSNYKDYPIEYPYSVTVYK